MYSTEIKDENCSLLAVLHFPDLVKAYDFVRNFSCEHWAWDRTWKHICVTRILNECDDEGIATESIQFTISREACEELKR